MHPTVIQNIWYYSMTNLWSSDRVQSCVVHIVSKRVSDLEVCSARCVYSGTNYNMTVQWQTPFDAFQSADIVFETPWSHLHVYHFWGNAEMAQFPWRQAVKNVTLLWPETEEVNGANTVETKMLLLLVLSSLGNGSVTCGMRAYRSLWEVAGSTYL